MDEKDGWKGSRPHHHIINVTVCGAWWSGKPDEHGIPHTICADGTPNGHTVMHFDGVKYMLDYKAARRGADEQIRVTAPEVLASASTGETSFRANVFNAIPGAVVEWRLDEGSWQAMTKTENEIDPLFQSLYDEEQQIGKENLKWRGLAKPLVCPHLWKATLPASMNPGTYLIQVRATNSNGQVFVGERMLRVNAE